MTTQMDQHNKHGSLTQILPVTTKWHKTTPYVFLGQRNIFRLNFSHKKSHTKLHFGKVFDT